MSARTKRHMVLGSAGNTEICCRVVDSLDGDVTCGRAQGDGRNMGGVAAFGGHLDVEAAFEPGGQQLRGRIACTRDEVTTGDPGVRLIEGGCQQRAPWRKPRPRQVGVAGCIITRHGTCLLYTSPSPRD